MTWVRLTIFSLVVLFLTCGRGLAQELDVDRFAIGLGVHRSVYLGDFGNGFLDFGQKFNAGTSLGFEYQWSRSYALGFRWASGKLSYLQNTSEANRNAFNLQYRSYGYFGRYELNNGLILPIDSKYKISLPHQIGLNDYHYESGFVQNRLGIALGLGVRFSLIDDLEIQYQFLTHFSGTDNLEGKDIAQSQNRDIFLSHELGVRYLFDLSDDRDGDGVMDVDDACPNQVGTKEMNGCPDSDLDGISDLEDECIHDPGPISARGCPDSDGDGILDKRDRCPDLFGPKATAGCPDTDGDGLLDPEDECPQLFGPKKYQGCPDTDGDGVEDRLDQCPSIKGLKSLNGCPDRDRDGTPDELDKCPDMHGPSSTQGCPDTDGDGIIDAEDDCPSIAGTPSRNGCPDDGFFHVDELDRIAESISFSGKSKKLLPSSSKAIRELARYLGANPDYKLRITGHMDARGDEELNMIYSLERAGAVKDALIRVGIKSFRIIAVGLGETEAGPEGSAQMSYDRRIQLEVALR